MDRRRIIDSHVKSRKWLLEMADRPDWDESARREWLRMADERIRLIWDLENAAEFDFEEAMRRLIEVEAEEDVVKQCLARELAEQRMGREAARELFGDI